MARLLLETKNGGTWVVFRWLGPEHIQNHDWQDRRRATECVRMNAALDPNNPNHPSNPVPTPAGPATQSTGDAAEPETLAYTPWVEPEPQARRRTREIAPITLADPLRWLARGWRDMSDQPLTALFYGLCFWVMAMVLGLVFRNLPEYTMSIVSGCFLVGPFLAMGLYDVSRRHERGEPQNFFASLTCWDTRIKSMALLLLVLLVLELLWGRASLVVFAVFFSTGMPTTAGVLKALVDPQNWQFLMVYLSIGGVFAALVFSTCVVSIPMILDRDTDAISAGLASFQLVLAKPHVMLFWGLLIIALVLPSLLLPWWAVGILVVGPWLGHASWHAYRGSVRWLE